MKLEVNGVAPYNQESSEFIQDYKFSIYQVERIDFGTNGDQHAVFELNEEERG